MCIKVIYDDKNVDFESHIDSFRIDLDKGVLLAYRGMDYRSIFLADVKKIILKED